MGEQQEKLTVAQAIIVEGKYDKIKLDSIIQGVILSPTATGFSRIRRRWR